MKEPLFLYLCAFMWDETKKSKIVQMWKNVLCKNSQLKTKHFEYFYEQKKTKWDKMRILTMTGVNQNLFKAPRCKSNPFKSINKRP